MKRFQWFAVGCSFVGAVASAVSLAHGSNPVVFGGLLALNVTCGLLSTYLLTRETRHGSNRGTEADPLDPEADDLSGTYATGGALSPITFTVNPSPGLTYQQAILASIPSFSSGGIDPAKGPTREVERVESDMPILAHRIARLHFDGKKPFASLNEGVRFGADADAQCTRDNLWHFTYAGSTTGPKQHKSPSLGCGCGFYALPSDIDPWDDGTAYVTLMVELSGTVIEHEKGYRAEHQRVIECQIPPCPYCGQQATTVLAEAGKMVGTACSRHLPSTPKPDVVAVSIEDMAAIVKVPVTCRVVSEYPTGSAK